MTSKARGGSASKGGKKTRGPSLSLRSSPLTFFFLLASPLALEEEKKKFSVFR